MPLRDKLFILLFSLLDFSFLFLTVEGDEKRKQNCMFNCYTLFLFLLQFFTDHKLCDLFSFNIFFAASSFFTTDKFTIWFINSHWRFQLFHELFSAFFLFCVFLCNPLCKKYTKVKYHRVDLFYNRFSRDLNRNWTSHEMFFFSALFTLFQCERGKMFLLENYFRITSNDFYIYVLCHLAGLEKRWFMNVKCCFN